MIRFSRYPHVKDLITHYSLVLANDAVEKVMKSGMHTEQDAEILSRFIWEMVGQMNQDEESGVEVLGSIDNSEMIPDISYEISKTMREAGYFSIWKKVSDVEM